MNEESCAKCGGSLKPTTTTFDFNKGDNKIILENVPVIRCDNCGEEYFSSKISEDLDIIYEHASDLMPDKKYNFEKILKKILKEQINTESEIEWLKQKIGYLDKNLSMIKRIESTIKGEVGIWSLQKLISLGYVIPTYTNIIPTYFDKMFYVDLFAGSGVNKLDIDGNSYDTLGSPIIAINAAAKQYDHMIFVEKDPDKYKALKLRLNALSNNPQYSWIKDRYTCINKEADSSFDEIMAIIRANCTEYEFENNRWHSFWFIDPYKNSELKYDTISQIFSNTISDILINFLTDETWRAVSSLKQAESEVINDLFGPLNWKEFSNKKDMAKQYIQQIGKIKDPRDKPRNKQKNIPIYASEKNKTDPYYNLFFLTVTTPNKNPWLSSLDSIINIISEVNSNKIKIILEILFENQTVLDDFF